MPAMRSESGAHQAPSCSFVIPLYKTANPLTGGANSASFLQVMICVVLAPMEVYPALW